MNKLINKIKLLYFISNNLYKMINIYNIVKNNTTIIIQKYVINNIPHLITIIYVLSKFYRTIYFTKIVSDQVPLFHPYKWPSSILRIFCKPYSDFWNSLFPKIRLFGTVLDISYFIGLESLHRLTKALLMLKYFSLKYVKN